MTALWQQTDDGWSLLRPAGFPDEATLRDLVAEAPELMPLSGSPQVAVLGREVNLGSGFTDILAVESSGRPVVIEVKLAQNAEARRAVVSQALAYASYLDGLSVEQLERDVLYRALRNAGHANVADAVAAQDQEGAFESDAFARGLEESLSQGSFRVVLVLDEAPQELVKLVGYLERVTADLTIDLIVVAAYEVGNSKVIVPQRVDPARQPAEEVRPKPQGGELTPGAETFERNIERGSPDAELLTRLVAWARMLEREGLVRLQSYRAVDGRMTLLPYAWNEDAGLVTIWNDGRASLSFWKSVFKRAAPHALEVIESKLGVRVGQGTTTREITDELLDAVADGYREAVGSETVATGV